MGNFSQDPTARAVDAAKKHYVAVRMQQAVPLLDADWNLLEDIRRQEHETVGTFFIGDGVPTPSDGFRIFSVGVDNDFGIRNGLLIASGKLVQINLDFRYTTQPHFNDPAVTPPINALPTPGPDVQFTVYLETWEREVDSQGDASLVDPRIGVETAIRLKREWAVRVVRLSDFSGAIAALPAGHFAYPLAQLNRASGNAAITDDMIVDLRDTDASARREIAYRRGQSNLVLVSTAGFLNTITTTRDNVSDFLEYLTTKFVDPATPYFAAEVMGLETLRGIASLADHGIALVNSKALDARGALKFMAQLLAAENRFLSIWKNFLLPLVKPTGTIYKNAFQGMVQVIETFLTGPAPGGFITLGDAVNRGNLLECQRSQDQINVQFAGEVSKPTGFITVTYLGSAAGAIVKTVPFDVRYRVAGNLTPADAIQADIFVDPEWKTELRNADASIPFNLKLGPGADSREFLVRITPSNAAPPSVPFSLRAFAQHNSGGVQFVSGQITLAVGSPPPPSSDSFSLLVSTTNLPQVAGVFQITAGKVGNMTFSFANQTNSAVAFSLDFTPKTQAGWTIKPPLGVDLTNQTVPARGQDDFPFQFLSATAGQSLVLVLTAKDTSQKVLAQTQVTLTTV